MCKECNSGFDTCFDKIGFIFSGNDFLTDKMTK